jgi:3-dehydroquinate synthase
MKKLTLKHSQGAYDISIEKGLFKNLPEQLENFDFSGGLVITDKNVNGLYKEKIDRLGYPVISVTPGESSKTLEIYGEVIEKVIATGLSRDGIILAIGGGVIGDLAGFVAATYLRGVPYIQIPTTLLAQVDSSIGGKVAVNSKQGKNLIGNFYQPKAVFIDPEFLLTLKPREIRSGMGELIKHGMIQSEELFKMIEKTESFNELYESIEDVLEASLTIKKQVVEEDTFDYGRRMILNFGHTIGHGIEKKSETDAIAHGEGIAIGMALITKIYEAKGETSKGLYQRLVNVLKNYELPYTIKTPLSELFEYIEKDKKIMNNQINVIVPKSLGSVEVKAYALEEFKRILGGN